MNPIYQVHLHVSCEVKLFKGDYDAKSCDQRITRINNPLWQRMMKSNSWLYVCLLYTSRCV